MANKALANHQHSKSVHELIVRKGRSRVFSVRAVDFNEHHLAQLQEMFGDASSKLLVELAPLAEIPADWRYSLLKMLKDHHVWITPTIEGVPCPDVFAAALMNIVSVQDIARHASTIKTAIEAAAVFFGDPYAADAAAEKIHRRQCDVGAPPTTVRRLAADIKALSMVVAPSGAEQSDALAMTRAYITELQGGFADPRVFFFRSSFFIFDGVAWRRMQSEDMASELTAYLQKQPGCKVTTRFVGDCMTNLKGACRFPDQHAKMPLFIDSLMPYQSSRRKYLNLQNGILDLDAAVAGELSPLLPHDARHFSMQRIEYAFDGSAECPLWLAFLNQVLPVQNEHDLRQMVLQEFFGYTLLSQCSFEKALILFGQAAAGKSTITNVLRKLLGPRNVSNISYNELGDQFRLVDLEGKAANISSELDHLGRSDENRLKQLITGEPISANRKHLSAVDLQSHAKLVIACNELPNFQDGSDGIWRRLLIVPFKNPVPPADRNIHLASQLETEPAGILNWALAGLRRLLNEGEFSQCRVCQNELLIHRRNSDTVAEFLSDCVVRTQDARAHAQRLYEVYRFYSQRSGRPPYSRSVFNRRVSNKGYSKRRAGAPDAGIRPYFFQGLELNADGQMWAQQYIAATSAPWNIVAISTPMPS